MEKNTTNHDSTRKSIQLPVILGVLFTTNNKAQLIKCLRKKRDSEMLLSANLGILEVLGSRDPPSFPVGLGSHLVPEGHVILAVQVDQSHLNK